MVNALVWNTQQSGQRQFRKYLSLDVRSFESRIASTKTHRISILQLKKFMESSHDSKQSNTGVKSPHDSTTINSKAQKAWHNNKPSLQNEQFCETSRTKTNYSNNYSLRSKHKKTSEHIPNTEYDVTQDR